jgi:tRNA-2-methylthio-N6-dimethylallyladenosine synthase
MNRRYTRDDYISLVEKIKKSIPDVSLTTDIMVGFPGETEEDFDEVLSLMNIIMYENAFMYYYNLRDGTPASIRTDQITTEVKKERLQKVIDLQLEITRKQMEKRVNQNITVLVEGVSRDNKFEVLARTPQDERVVFEASDNLIGKFVQVKLDKLVGNTFKGILINN